eukprot:4844467-Pyramimonas_sp.AAC.1
MDPMRKPDFLQTYRLHLMYGDGVPVSNSSGAMCIPIGSSICANFLSSLEKLFWLGGYCARGGVKDCDLGATKTHFWKRLIYLLKVLDTGCFPENEKDGNAFPDGSRQCAWRDTFFAGGPYFAVWLTKGDT